MEYVIKNGDGLYWDGNAFVPQQREAKRFTVDDKEYIASMIGNAFAFVPGVRFVRLRPRLAD